MYPDSGYKLAHAQSVCTRPFSPRWEGPGDEARSYSTVEHAQTNHFLCLNEIHVPLILWHLDIEFVYCIDPLHQTQT